MKKEQRENELRLNIHERAKVHSVSFILSGPCAPRARERSRADFFLIEDYFQSRES